MLDERCPIDLKPHLRDPYTFSKVLQEQAAQEVAEETRLALVIIRPGVIYGPGRSCITGRLGLSFGRWLIRMGGGQRVPYTYVDNVADAVVRAGIASGVEGQEFNIIDDDLPRARTLVRMYRNRIGGLRVIPVPFWAIAPLSLWKNLRYSNDLAKARLGWTPAIDFDEGLRRTFEFLD